MLLLVPSIANILAYTTVPGVREGGGEGEGAAGGGCSWRGVPAGRRLDGVPYGLHGRHPQ